MFVIRTWVRFFLRLLAGWFAIIFQFEKVNELFEGSLNIVKHYKRQQQQLFYNISMYYCMLWQKKTKTHTNNPQSAIQTLHRRHTKLNLLLR